MNPKEVTKEFYEWTLADWRYINELAKVLDQTLGPAKKSGEPRIITHAVIERLREAGVKRIGSARVDTSLRDGSGQAE